MPANSGCAPGSFPAAPEAESSDACERGGPGAFQGRRILRRAQQRNVAKQEHPPAMATHNVDDEQPTTTTTTTTTYTTGATRLAASAGADLAAAALTALTVSPAVCLIDNAVASRVATGRPIAAYAAHYLACPHTLLRNLLASPAGRYVYIVYFATFATANLADSALAARNNSSNSNSSTSTSSEPAAQLAKFAAVAGVSTAVTVWKDVRLAHCFAQAGAARVPAASVGLFMVRDCVTILTAFTLPPVVARASAVDVEGELFALKGAQLLLPIIAQFVTTPIHLAGYYLHYDRARRGFWRRLRQVRADVGSAVPIRMLRILPAMGVGNVVNTALREQLTSTLKTRP